MKKVVLMLAMFLLGACSNKDFQTVTFYGWGGDPAVNNWIDTVLAPALKEQHAIILKRVPMNADEILNKLNNEKTANSKGDIDLIWINGENFFAAKNAGLLTGELPEQIPNFQKYIGDSEPDAQNDFGYPIDGYEIPYGKAQLVFIADSAKLKTFPKSAKELLAFAKTHPQQFTYPAPPDFVGSAFIRNIICDIVGFDKVYQAKADYDDLLKVIQPAIDFLNELAPYLWQQGKTYPKDNAALDKMFVDGQILWTMNYTPLYAGQKVLAGQFPDTVRTFVFDKGTVGNTHYVAIPFNAPNKTFALTLINLILSPAMQISKYDIKNWGDLPVFNINKLSKEEKSELAKINNAKNVLSPDELLNKRIPELQADKVAIIEKIWMDKVGGK